MKRIKTCCCILVIAAMAGCATHSTIVVSEPVGPDLAPARVNVAGHDGQLVVYTALEVADAVSSDFPTHAGYAIYSRGESCSSVSTTVAAHFIKCRPQWRCRRVNT